MAARDILDTALWKGSIPVKTNHRALPDEQTMPEGEGDNTVEDELDAHNDNRGEVQLRKHDDETGEESRHVTSQAGSHQNGNRSNGSKNDKILKDSLNPVNGSHKKESTDR